MGGGIDFNPLIADSIRWRLKQSHGTLMKQAVSFETYAQTLETSWRDENASDVVELILSGRTMYETVASQMLQTIDRLDQLEEIYTQQQAARAAEKALMQHKRDQAGERVAGQVRSQGLLSNQEYRERYPDDDRGHSSIGPDRYR